MMLLTFVLGAIMLAIISTNSRTALDMTEQQGQTIYAIMEIQYESAQFHLWLEELLSGDTTVDEIKVWHHLEQAKKYAYAILNGDETEDGSIPATDSVELRQQIKTSLTLLQQLGVLAKRRLSNVADSAPGKPIDTQFDLLYNDAQQQLENTELTLRQIIKQQKKEYILFSFIMGAIVFLFTLLSAYIFYRHESQRIEYIVQLKDSETRQRVIMDNMIGGVITISDKGIIDSVNSAMESIFGYRVEEMIGSNVNFLMPEPHHPLHDGYLKNYNEGGESNILGVTRKLEGQRKDGSVFPIEISVSEVKLGGHRMYSGIIWDISERTEAEAELLKYRKHLEELVEERTEEMKASRDEAEKASHAKSEFLSHMSHELRTPMNAILGFGQLLNMESGELSNTQKDHVTEILAAGYHLLTLINEILDLTRIESGKLEISMEKIALGKVMQQSIALLQPLADSRHIEFIDHVSNKEYLVEADATRLKQVLVNLLSNAVKYNRENGEIILDSELVNERCLRISVTDKGKGLSAEDIKKLFVPFERLDMQFNVDGVGIGLVITQHLMELMSGSIGVTSTVGEGSTFWLEFVLPQQSECQ